MCERSEYVYYYCQHQNTYRFFNCKLDGVLKVNNTRLLAYLMMQLSCYNYIIYEWQSVIANNKLILKKIKGEPLTRTDLSSATDQAKNIYPKGYEIIDKYIKQLQKVEHRLNAQTKVN